MNLLFTILILLSFNMISFAQHNFGIKLNGGISRISNNIYKTILNIDPAWHVRVAPSGQVGLYYNLHIGNKSVLGTELLFNQIEGKEKLKIYFTDAFGKTTESSIDHIYKHISYLCLPVYYGLKFNKLAINIGAQASYAIASSAREKGQTTDGVYKWDNKYDKLNIDKYDYGARAGFDYTISSKFSIDGNFYYGLNNIFKSNFLSWKWKVRQLTLGVRYNLKYTEAKKEETK